MANNTMNDEETTTEDLVLSPMLVLDPGSEAEHAWVAAVSINHLGPRTLSRIERGIAGNAGNAVDLAGEAYKVVSVEVLHESPPCVGHSKARGAR